jgi:hypothetical protein
VTGSSATVVRGDNNQGVSVTPEFVQKTQQHSHGLICLRNEI